MIDPPSGYTSWMFYVAARYDALTRDGKSDFCLPEAGKHAREEANELLNELSELRELRKSNKSVGKDE